MRIFLNKKEAENPYFPIIQFFFMMLVQIKHVKGSMMKSNVEKAGIFQDLEQKVFAYVCSKLGRMMPRSFWKTTMMNWRKKETKVYTETKEKQKLRSKNRI